LEYFSADESVESKQHSNHHSEDDDAELEGPEEVSGKGEDTSLPIAHISSIQRDGLFRIRGVLGGQQCITLLDTGATHNFIDEGLVTKRGLKTEEFEGFC